MNHSLDEDMAAPVPFIRNNNGYERVDGNNYVPPMTAYPQAQPQPQLHSQAQNRQQPHGLDNPMELINRNLAEFQGRGPANTDGLDDDQLRRHNEMQLVYAQSNAFKLNTEPTSVYCINCHKQVTTIVKSKIGNVQWLAC